jgi:2-keto-4-pentenoate hydratase/2-oxohepta-3-ene-1,7-dioic acid hydratase in catechol pathway
MSETRRDFLKATGGVGVAAATAAIAAPGRATAAGETQHAFEMPRNMTLLTMRREGGTYGLGVKTDKGILDVTAAAQALNMPAPADMDDLLQNGKGGILKTLADAAAARGPQAIFVKEDSVQYGPVVTRPEKIIMMGFNYRKHAEETGTPIPKDPPLFNKYNNALNHHNGRIKLPTAAAKQFDYEVELVIVFGKEARDVSEEDALNYVAGYCTGNDFSARDLQTLTSQFMIGKTCDGFAPLGPHFVTSDLVGDPNNLRLETRVNGEQRQDWNTNDMIFNCRQLISFASKVMTLKPGDIFFTGTPQGVIFGQQPKDKRVWLKPGDKVACSVEKLGELRFDLV